MMRLPKRLYIVAAALFVAAIGLAATNFPSIVASRANLGAYTSTVAGTLATAEVVEWGHFGFWRYSPTSSATPDGVSVIEPSDSPAAGRWLLQSGTINGNVTFTVCASGCAFPTVQAAVTAINAMNVTPGAIINLSLPCTALTSTTPVTIFPPVGGSLYISGCAHTNYSATSVVSSSGSAGAWTVTLQLSSSVSGITADNDYVIITGASGGTNPTRLVGVWPVTAVNTGSNQIAITTTNHAAAAPSGSVTATVADIQSVLAFTGVNGIDVWAGAAVVNLQNVVLVGNKTANTNGLDVEDNGRAYINNDFGVYGFGGAGVYATLSSEINSSATVASSGNGIGFHALSNSVISLGGSCIASGNTTYGVTADNVSKLACATGNISGNGSDGARASTFSYIDISGSGGFQNDNGGWGANSGVDLGLINTTSTTQSGNTSGGVNSTTSIASLTVGGTLLCASTLQCTGFSTVQTSGDIYVGSDSDAILERNGNDLALQTFGGYGIDLLGGGVEVGAATGGVKGSGTLNMTGAIYANGTIGATCSGTPTSSFASVGGIVTHC
ncbi:MAG: hypothetical protein ACREHF_02185 [Rhizomicrobium sp.]